MTRLEAASFRPMRWGAGALALVLVLTLGACADGDRGSASGATVPDGSSTTTTTIDITTVPDEITVDYAQAVMDELDQILGEAIRELVRARQPNERFYNLLNAVYDDPSFENQQQFFGEEAARGLKGFATDPENPRTHIREVLKGTSTCVVVAVEREIPYLENPGQDGLLEGWVALRRSAPTSDPVGLNPSAWSIVFDGGTLDDQPPVTAC